MLGYLYRNYYVHTCMNQLLTIIHKKACMVLVVLTVKEQTILNSLK